MPENNRDVWLKHLVVSAAIGLLFSLSPTTNWASPMCEMNVTVSEFQADEQPAQASGSVAEAFQGRDQDSAFVVFALAAEQALLEAADERFCADAVSGDAVEIDITVVELGFTATDAELERLRSMKIGVRGSYSELSIDTNGRSAEATIIWNPRRMLRDQLSLISWEIDETIPLLPFSQTEFNTFLAAYSSRVLRASSWEEADLRMAEVRGTMPDDLYALFIHSGRTTRLPFQGIVLSTYERLLDASREAYTEITISAINQNFEIDSRVYLNSVNDLNRIDIRELYKQIGWSNFVPQKQ